MKALTLLPDQWYACEFIPEDPIRKERMYSPIKIYSVKTFKDGSGRITLSFYHAYYPEGVRDKVYDLKVLRRTTNSVLAVRNGEDKLVLLISRINAEWLMKHFDILIPIGPDVTGWLNAHV